MCVMALWWFIILIDGVIKKKSVYITVLGRGLKLKSNFNTVGIVSYSLSLTVLFWEILKKSYKG